MHTRMENAYGQLKNFTTGLGNSLWDTIGLIIDIMLEFLGRSLELILTILNLILQMIIFLRDMCIQALQTFVDIFRRIVNIVGLIDTDDVEDFATACIVVILWIGAGRLILTALEKKNGHYNSLNFMRNSNAQPKETVVRFDQDYCSDHNENEWNCRGSSRKKKSKSNKSSSSKY